MKCKQCGSQISFKDVECPNCHAKIKKIKLSTIIISLLVLITLTRIVSHTIYKFITENIYQLEYGTLLKNYDDLDELLLEYGDSENLNSLMNNSIVLSKTMGYLSEEYDMNYTIEIEGDLVTGYQINSTLEDIGENKWDFRFNGVDNSLSITVQFKEMEKNFNDLIRIDMLNEYVKGIYQIDLNYTELNALCNSKIEDNLDFHYMINDLLLEASIDEAVGNISLYLI